MKMRKAVDTQAFLGPLALTALLSFEKTLMPRNPFFRLSLPTFLLFKFLLVAGVSRWLSSSGNFWIPPVESG